MGLTWGTSTDWDNGQTESKVVHANLDGYTDNYIRQGYLNSSYTNRQLFLRFTGNQATDYSGNNFDGTINGAITNEQGPFSSNSFYFDGSGANVSVPDAAPINVDDTNELTLMAWVKRNGPQASNATIMTKNGSYYFQIDVDKVAVYTYHDSGNSSYNYSTATVPNSTWTHVCFREKTDGTRDIFINGVLDSTHNMESSITDKNNDALGIGYELSGSRPFDGWIAYPMMFDAAISDSVIETLGKRQGTFTSSTKMSDSKMNYLNVKGNIEGNTEITIYQDEAGGTTPTNQSTISISQAGSYDLDGFTSVTGSAFWFDLTLGENSNGLGPAVGSIDLSTSSSPTQYVDQVGFSEGSIFPSIKVTSSDTTTDLNVSNTIVPWTDAEYIDSSTFTFDSTNNQITVEEDGIYEMRAVIYTLSNGAGARSNPVARFSLNNSTYLEGWGGSGYTRNSEGHLNSSNSPHNIEELSAGDSIHVETFQEADGGSTRTMESNTSVFMMKKLPGEVTISSKPVEGRETGLINAGNQGIVTVCNLQNGETLSIQSAGFTLSDGQAVPSSLNLEIITMDNAGGYTVQKTIISGDGSTIHDQLSGDPYTSWTNNTGSSSTVAVIVNNNTTSNQDVISYIEGQIE